MHHGRVVSCRDFGCFVRLPGCPRDGLLHISQVSDRRIDASELSQLLPVGREVWVKVTDIKEDGKMSLTAKNVPGHERDALGGGGGGGGGGSGGVATTKSAHAKPPELFSIHRAEVSNATDFAVFVTLQPSGWDAMVHSTQLDEGHLLECGARTLSQGYPKGAKCWVKVSAVDGYSSKAKLQASVKYVDQASGRDLDPQNEKLLLDLTHRGLPSEMNARWRPAGYNSDGEEEGGGGVDGAALKAGVPFAPSAHFAGARPGYVFTTRESGVGYYRDPLQPMPGEGAGDVLQQMLAKMEEGRKARKRARKEEKRAKKERKKERKGDKGERKDKKKDKKGDKGERSSRDAAEGERDGKGAEARKRARRSESRSSSSRSSSG